jgi:UDPglucose 6-dehydrogenase
MNPERIIIGTNSGRAKEILERLYFPLVRSKSPLIFMSRRSAEISKYAANAFLATKISFINEIASFCEAAGGDVREIARGIGLDSRIGSRFLHAGIGYGGSCFPKDVQALIQSGKEYNADLEILKATEVVNSRQKKKIFNWLLAKLPQLENKQIAVWGLSFKPRTDDMRDAPSIKVIKKLQGEGAKVRVFDPVAMENAQKIFSKVNLTYAQSPLAAAKKADALIILTEWDVFRSVDPEDLAKAMKGKLILDGRNILNEQEMQRYGFQVLGIGRQQND